MAPSPQTPQESSKGARNLHLKKDLLRKIYVIQLFLHNLTIKSNFSLYSIIGKPPKKILVDVNRCKFSVVSPKLKKDF